MGGLIKIQCLLYLECPEDVMEARLLARQRGDDNINTIRKR
jgi:adenylate kinase family enzyme